MTVSIDISFRNVVVLSKNEATKFKGGYGVKKVCLVLYTNLTGPLGARHLVQHYASCVCEGVSE